MFGLLFDVGCWKKKCLPRFMSESVFEEVCFEFRNGNLARLSKTFIFRNVPSCAYTTYFYFFSYFFQCFIFYINVLNTSLIGCIYRTDVICQVSSAVSEYFFLTNCLIEKLSFVCLETVNHLIYIV